LNKIVIIVENEKIQNAVKLKTFANWSKIAIQVFQE